MLFHLAHPFLAGQKRIQVETALERLIDRHGRGNWGGFTLKLTFPPNPNGLYMLKGGGPDRHERLSMVGRRVKAGGSGMSDMRDRLTGK
jgi:hypothetical protein